MTRVSSLITQGGPIMWPLLALSVITVACAIERSWFWLRLLTQENRLVKDVLEAAHYDLDKAAEIANSAQNLPIGRFLIAPLKLKKPTPETFRLAMEAAGDREFIKMRTGDKILETIVAVSPLLGLLGTVTGLIGTFNNLNIGSGGSTEEAAGVAQGIGEALLTT
ncbi:MAG: MotA/TolQ/ExbB proton channel family protein, partial [Spirulinaceae cyanobacterium]